MAQTIAIRKGEHVYIVRFPNGHYSSVLDAAQSWAENPNLNFDYMDAIVLAYQLTRLPLASLNESPDGISNE